VTAKAEEVAEEESQEAAYDPVTGEINWDCPCLGGMAQGPCGEQFKAAFSCFVHSSEDPKGVDCIDKFKGMQDCFREREIGLPSSLPNLPDHAYADPDIYAKGTLVAPARLSADLVQKSPMMMPLTTIPFRGQQQNPCPTRSATLETRSPKRAARSRRA
jgi:hypothetical protein